MELSVARAGERDAQREGLGVRRHVRRAMRPPAAIAEEVGAHRAAQQMHKSREAHAICVRACCVGASGREGQTPRDPPGRAPPGTTRHHGAPQGELGELGELGESGESGTTCNGRVAVA